MKNFIHDSVVYNTKSAEETVPYIIDLCHPQTVIDVGCGLGTWLSIFEKHGISDVCGIDGDYVDLDQLTINSEKFYPHDLSTPLLLNKRFDLAISLEVAEHIDEKNSEIFIQSLVSLSDNIVFSAALKGQGGQGHINEEYFEYWKNKFFLYGYNFYDIFRPAFWWNKRVDYWYAQNMFMVSKHEFKEPKERILSAYHPRFIEAITKENESSAYQPRGVRHALTLLTKSLKAKLK